jgi:hypothetical protein
MDHKWPKTLSKIHQTRSNMRAKIDPKSVLEEVLGALGGSWGGVWGGLGEGLGGLGGHVGPKMGPRAQNPVRWTPLDPQVGSQNRAKIGPKPVQNAIFFLMGCWTEFKSILVPIWLQLGSQNPPKMEPSWVPNRSNLEHRFGS